MLYCVGHAIVQPTYYRHNKQLKLLNTVNRPEINQWIDRSPFFNPLPNTHPKLPPPPAHKQLTWSARCPTELSYKSTTLC